MTISRDLWSKSSKAACRERESCKQVVRLRMAKNRQVVRVMIACVCIQKRERVDD